MPSHLRMFALALLLAMSLLAAACGDDNDDATSTPADDGKAALAGGLLASFQVGEESFRVWITNPATIQQVLDLEVGASTASIPTGRILDGPGTGDHNAPWTWHLDPEDIEMADFTIEVCDATPSYVEDNKREFIDVVLRYCPWSAELASVEDYR